MPENAPMNGLTVEIAALGGITQTRVALEPGVSVLSGPNATNKTSFLRAVAGALGGSALRPNAQTDAGRVSLDVGGETFARTYEYSEGDVVATGTPFVDDPALIDTFVTLLESNPIRRAVERDGNLRDLLMTPVDEAAIQADIDRVKTERETIDEQLAQLEEDADRLPTLRDRRDELAGEVADLEDEIDSLEASIVDAQGIDDETTGSPERSNGSRETDDARERLDEARRDIADVRDRIERERNSLEALRSERTTVADELAAIETDTAGIEDRTREIERLESKSRRLDELVSDLATVVNFNEKLVDDDRLDELESVRADEEPAAALDPASNELTCWTCGSDVTREAIAERLRDVQSLVEETRSEREALEDRMRTLRSERNDLEAAVDDRERLERRRDEIDAEIERREARLESLTAEAAACRERIEAAEEDIAAAVPANAADFFDQQERFSELAYERGRLENELADVRSEIGRIETRLEDRESLRSQRGSLTTELSSLRTRIDDLEREVVSAFNEHVGALLDRLEYANVERVRLGRRVDDASNGTGRTSTFELHVTRSDDSGTAFSGTVETLSESESDVVGLAAALAGYLAHDVHEDVPVMLLDSLEALDAERIRALVDYLRAHVEFLVVALLPEDTDPITEFAHVIASEQL